MIKKLKTIVVFGLIIILIQFSVISTAASKSQLQNQQSTLNSKIKETEQALQQIKTEKSTTMTEVQNLITQISEFESEIDKLDGQIDDFNKKIDEAQANLDKAVEEYNE